MRGRSRRGVTLVELMVVVGVIGVLTGLAAPAVTSIRQQSITNEAITDLRAVEVAIMASCGKGRCGNFYVTPGSAIARQVPDDLKEFLPSGFEFKTDSSAFAIEVETWEVTGNTAAWPLCRRSCRNALDALATSSEDKGFVNTRGFTAPNTIYVSVTILTRNEDVAQSMFARAGGSVPWFKTDHQVWVYTYPILVGVPATG